MILKNSSGRRLGSWPGWVVLRLGCKLPLVALWVELRGRFLLCWTASFLASQGFVVVEMSAYFAVPVMNEIERKIMTALSRSDRSVVGFQRTSTTLRSECVDEANRTSKLLPFLSISIMIRALSRDSANTVVSAKILG